MASHGQPWPAMASHGQQPPLLHVRAASHHICLQGCQDSQPQIATASHIIQQLHCHPQLHSPWQDTGAVAKKLDNSGTMSCCCCRDCQASQRQPSLTVHTRTDQHARQTRHLAADHYRTVCLSLCPTKLAYSHNSLWLIPLQAE